MQAWLIRWAVSQLVKILNSSYADRLDYGTWAQYGIDDVLIHESTGEPMVILHGVQSRKIDKSTGLDGVSHE